MNEAQDILNIGNVKDTPMEKALGERYLNYALSTIMSRSLPDVRDGLKPVHRRLLYAMFESGNFQSKPYRKSASAVGYVMMKYHPHADGPIYDAMVRMAQDFSMRYPLIDGQGNFGNIDGDNAAAMRYTEARLSEFGEALLEGLRENAVDFQPSYTGEFQEPKVMPSSVPNLLANGSMGIAVGMATNIPPHNISELCDALRLLIKNPDANTAAIMKLLPGPDFPTGGIILESPSFMEKAYEDGKGSIRVRARWEIEQLKNGQYQAVITQIPYQVPKSRLIEKIAELLNDKKLPLVGDIIDESTVDVRVVIEPKSRTVDPHVLMESLFRTTELESRFNLNMNVLDADCIPKVMPIGGMLRAFLNHRQDVLVRRSNFRLDQIDKRLEVLKGFMIAYLNIEEVIRIIRFEDEPKEKLISTFSLSDVQAEAILNMRLRSLRKLEEFEIRREIKDLEKEETELKTLVNSPEKQWQIIEDQISEIKNKFGARHVFGKRRTTFEKPPEGIEVPTESDVVKEPVTIICSANGWIRTAKGHNLNSDDIKYKEGDSAGSIIQAQTTDKLLVYASNGRFYTISVDKLPSSRGFGEPIRLMIELGTEDEIISLRIYNNSAESKLLLASKDGRGFIVKESDVLAQTRNGKQILNVSDKEKAFIIQEVNGDSIALIGDNRKLIVYKVAEIPEMARGKGVRLQFYRDGGVSDVRIFNEADGLTWKYGNGNRKVDDLLPWQGRRGQSGRLAPLGFPRNNQF